MTARSHPVRRRAPVHGARAAAALVDPTAAVALPSAALAVIAVLSTSVAERGRRLGADVGDVAEGVAGRQQRPASERVDRPRRCARGRTSNPWSFDGFTDLESSVKVPSRGRWAAVPTGRRAVQCVDQVPRRDEAVRVVELPAPRPPDRAHERDECDGEHQTLRIARTLRRVRSGQRRSRARSRRATTARRTRAIWAASSQRSARAPRFAPTTSRRRRASSVDRRAVVGVRAGVGQLDLGVQDRRHARGAGAQAEVEVLVEQERAGVERAEAPQQRRSARRARRRAPSRRCAARASARARGAAGPGVSAVSTPDGAARQRERAALDAAVGVEQARRDERLAAAPRASQAGRRRRAWRRCRGSAGRSTSPPARSTPALFAAPKPGLSWRSITVAGGAGGAAVGVDDDDLGVGRERGEQRRELVAPSGAPPSTTVSMRCASASTACVSRAARAQVSGATALVRRRRQLRARPRLALHPQQRAGQRHLVAARHAHARRRRASRRRRAGRTRSTASRRPRPRAAAARSPRATTA